MIQSLAEVSGLDVPRETFDLLGSFVDLLRTAATQQNLIAPSTFDSVWDRHILDSAQLVRFASSGSTWADVGSGAGLPGLVIAILTGDPITLIEPRRLRAEFLRQTADKLNLANVSVACGKVERVRGRFDVITARAVAPLDRLLAMIEHLSEEKTVWVFPKGRNAQSELAQARRNWHCEVRAERSCTDPESEILVLTRVGAKKKR